MVRKSNWNGDHFKIWTTNPTTRAEAKTLLNLRQQKLYYYQNYKDAAKDIANEASLKKRQRYFC
jgi:hypothetical protein